MVWTASPTRTHAPLSGLAVGLLCLIAISCSHGDQAPDRSEKKSDRTSKASGALAASSFEPTEARTASGFIKSIEDARLGPLREAALRWRQFAGPNRIVIDQVCLVNDVPEFFEAISAWDSRHFFPILIDDPAWTLPFIRAFRPTRVLRWSRPDPTRPGSTIRAVSRSGPTQADPNERRWQSALSAVARSWTDGSLTDEKLPPAGGVPRSLGPTPPGLVFSNPESPMLPGAVALAAGRFQPLVRLGPLLRRPASSSTQALPSPARFADLLSLDEAQDFALQIEARTASVIPSYERLGDGCDFLTLAGEWPFKYTNTLEQAPFRGEQALDDLIGRVHDPRGTSPSLLRGRWAFAGRILGDSSASVYRAMCSLFLHSESIVLWDTYESAGNWADYKMDRAADSLRNLGRKPVEPVHRARPNSSLLAWHQVFDPISDFGLIMVNSSGSPWGFSIEGGTGRPADLPRGIPVVVSMIHSFSAADPVDPSTLVGRWLSNGAFISYGAMNEPFLNSFRTPSLVAALAQEGIPLVASLRQGGYEAFGRPWRLVYLGDPLYRLGVPHDRPVQDRLAPRDWKDADGSPLASMIIDGSGDSLRGGPGPTDSDRLSWCWSAAIGSLCVKKPTFATTNQEVREQARKPDLTSVLMTIHRDRLDCRQRLLLDELVTDSLLASNQVKELLDWLTSLPADECTPRIWQAIESTAMARLYFLIERRDFGGSLDLWEHLFQLHWPAGSQFPSQITERLSSLTSLDPKHWLPLYRDRLIKASRQFEIREAKDPHYRILVQELKRMEPDPRDEK